MTKITKNDLYSAIISLVETGSTDVDTAEIVAFCNKEKDALARKAAKAKEKAAEKRAAGDALTDAVKAVLTDEAQTIADITAAIGDEEVTPAKVTYRLTQLVKDGFAVKSEIAVPATETSKARKVAGYAKA